VLTVPAARYASEHRVTGLGREQLIELFTRGAVSEVRGKELKAHQAQAEEAQAALRAALRELEAMRRQRNEASWALGEERARSAKLDAQLAAQQAAFAQQLQDRDTQLAQGEQRLADLRKQWEENEWYLGESRQRVRHVEAQFTALQDTAARLAEARRQRDEAQWYLGEERVQRAALQEEVDELKRRHSQEERRIGARVRVPQVQIEVYNGEEEPIFSGSPRDMSHSGVRLESDQGFPERESVRVRLSLPGHERIESRAQLRWRRFPSDHSPLYQSGYQLVELPGDARAVIEQVIAESVAAGGAQS
jgi:DNA repair exonuclease SbcCD ATPase subunit